MDDISTTKQRARAAGWLYLVICVSAPIGLMVVPGKLFVFENATATADNIRASGWLLRLGIASELFHQIIGVFLVLALYRLFKGVSEALATQLVIFGSLISLPIVFVNVLNEIAALILVRGPVFLSAFSRPQLDGLAYLFIRLHGQGIHVAAIFWGIWLFPFGMLVIRSGFIPRVLGVLLMVAGVGYLASSFATLVMPVLLPLISPIALPLEVGELPIIFWLLIWGARTRASEATGA